MKLPLLLANLPKDNSTNVPEDSGVKERRAFRSFLQELRYRRQEFRPSSGTWAFVSRKNELSGSLERVRSAVNKVKA
jgi:hypothetical protein